MTPGLNKAPPQEIRLAIPPTPGFSKPATLRHFQSSPSLPLVSGLSFSNGPSNSEKRRPQPLDTLFSPLKESFHVVEEEEQNFDVPLSREEKPEAYPNGPICIYEPNVYLYLEPTAAQASTFDVILNVASEVRNPFVTPAETPAIEPDIRIDGGGGIQYAPRRTPDVEQKASHAYQASEPSTQKYVATLTEEKQPEYIHIPWEHNSDIVPELLGLCKMMDEKVNEGKRVLVHCQCGVSRSASLVVAYGLYKAPQLSVQEAYDFVKSRSKWIGPNMNLIMQLQEFRSSLANGGRLASNRGSGMSPITPTSALSDWRSPFSVRQSSFGSQDGPLTGRISPSVEQKNSVDLGRVSPAPSSAPGGAFWQRNGSTANSINSIGTVRTTSAFVDPSGHVVPVLNIVDSNHPDFGKSVSALEAAPMSPALEAPPMELPLSPRAAEFAMLPLQPSQEVDSVDKFGLMSPTANGFGQSLFDRSALLASLGMGSMGRDEDTPRRSLSGRNRDSYVQAEPQPAPQPAPRLESLSFARRLRKKISAPSIREQEQLQSLQAKIKASLPLRRAVANLSTVDEALTSPRATEFTHNPFALTIRTEHRPHDPLRPRTSDGSDPRSPALTGANPITRNIYDVL
jgi:tyrosine-protein phosphatase